MTHALHEERAHRRCGAYLQRQRRGCALAAADHRDHLFPESADASIPVIAAAFDRFGDPRSSAVELIESDDDLVRMTWYDCIEPFVLNMPLGTDGRPIGVFSMFYPARSAQLSLNGRFAEGLPWEETRGDRPSTSAVLAWSETWVEPRG